jgi:hypothetical protein
LPFALLFGELHLGIGMEKTEKIQLILFNSLEKQKVNLRILITNLIHGLLQTLTKFLQRNTIILVSLLFQIPEELHQIHHGQFRRSGEYSMVENISSDVHLSAVFHWI